MGIRNPLPALKLNSGPAFYTRVSPLTDAKKDPARKQNPDCSYNAYTRYT